MVSKVFEVSDFFGLLSTRRAFKFRRGKSQGSFGALGFGASYGASGPSIATYDCRRPSLRDRLKLLREVVGFGGLQNVLGLEGC